MVSCLKIEIASLVFACLSLLATFLSFLWYGAGTIKHNMAMVKFITANETDYHGSIQNKIVDYGVTDNIRLSIVLSIIIVSFTYTIILTKGLLSKNAYLVKAYFISGVTMNTFAVLFGLWVTLAVLTTFGLTILFGCLLYSLCLLMIRNTYLKLATTDQGESCQKNLDAEKTISIKL